MHEHLLTFVLPHLPSALLDEWMAENVVLRRVFRKYRQHVIENSEANRWLEKRGCLRSQLLFTAHPTRQLHFRINIDNVDKPRLFACASLHLIDDYGNLTDWLEDVMVQPLDDKRGIRKRSDHGLGEFIEELRCSREERVYEWKEDEDIFTCLEREEGGESDEQERFVVRWTTVWSHVEIRFPFTLPPPTTRQIDHVVFNTLAAWRQYATRLEPWLAPDTTFELLLEQCHLKGTFADWRTHRRLEKVEQYLHRPSLPPEWTPNEVSTVVLHRLQRVPLVVPQKELCAKYISALTKLPLDAYVHLPEIRLLSDLVIPWFAAPSPHLVLKTFECALFPVFDALPTSWVVEHFHYRHDADVQVFVNKEVLPPTCHFDTLHLYYPATVRAWMDRWRHCRRLELHGRSSTRWPDLRGDLTTLEEVCVWGGRWCLPDLPPSLKRMTWWVDDGDKPFGTLPSPPSGQPIVFESNHRPLLTLAKQIGYQTCYSLRT